MIQESLYNITEHYGEDVKYKGFNYKDSIISRTSSNYLLQNTEMVSFLKYINDVFYELIESTKKIRVFINYTVDKDYKYIN